MKKLLFLGSSCIYPREVPQPMKEEMLMMGYLEPTNEPYAIAKIAGTPRKLLDVTKLKSLGWEPAIGLEYGLTDAYTWFKTNQANFRQ